MLSDEDLNMKILLKYIVSALAVMLLAGSVGADTVRMNNSFEDYEWHERVLRFTSDQDKKAL
ncbi:hypothetical protein GCM10007941_29780 [Amphritea balenae]|nr:hypothetical protein GCM10007941_29780 [Amphritea balenae]